MQKQSAIASEPTREEVNAVGDFCIDLSKVRNRQHALTLLEQLSLKVENGEKLPPELEQPVTQFFGATLWKKLAQWAPNTVSTLVSRLTTVAIERSKLFGEPLPGAMIPVEEDKSLVVAKEILGQKMLSDIIDIYKTNLMWYLDLLERGGAVSREELVSRVDLAIRYQTAARRDFYRALREYRETLQ